MKGGTGRRASRGGYAPGVRRERGTWRPVGFFNAVPRRCLSVGAAAKQDRSLPSSFSAPPCYGTRTRMDNAVCRKIHAQAAYREASAWPRPRSRTRSRCRSRHVRKHIARFGIILTAHTAGTCEPEENSNIARRSPFRPPVAILQRVPSDRDTDQRPASQPTPRHARTCSGHPCGRLARRKRLREMPGTSPGMTAGGDRGAGVESVMGSGQRPRVLAGESTRHRTASAEQDRAQRLLLAFGEAALQ